MKKIFIAVALSLTLAGCAGTIQKIENAWGVVNGATITPEQVYIAANAFDAVEASATQYLHLPVCGSAPCRNSGATATIVAAVRAGRLARNKLEATVNASPGAPVDANLLATLTSSTSTLKAILNEFGAS